MAGETRSDESGWTVDTLFAHLRAVLIERDTRTAQRFDAQEKALFLALKAHDDLLVQNAKALHDQIVAVDARHTQNSEAQEKAVQAALQAAKEAVNAALLAAQSAVTKAEGAAEKRFDAVNEFRGQLTDQAQTFMPRSEADVRLIAMKEQIDRIGGAVRENAGRLVGNSKTAERASYYLFGVLAFLVAVGGLVLAITR